jgi:hypothetical protein
MIPKGGADSHGRSPRDLHALRNRSAINLSPVVGDNERSMKGLLRRRRGHPTHRTNFVRNPARHVKHFGTICPLRLAAKPLG